MNHSTKTTLLRTARMCAAGFLLASFLFIPIAVWFAPPGSFTQRALMVVAVAQMCTALRIGVHQWHDTRSKEHE